MAEFPPIGIEAILDDKNFQEGLKRFTKGTEQMTDQSEKTAGALGKIGSVASGALVAGIGVAVAAIAGFVAVAKTGLDVTLDWAEQVDPLAEQLGMTGEEASKWAVAMQRVGLTVEEGASGLNFFTRGLAETTKVAKDGTRQLTPFGESLKKLGVSAYDAKGKLKTFDQVMPELMDGFKKLPAGVNSTALAMDLFGARGGTKFLEFLRQGKQGLMDADAFAKEFGLTLSDDTLDAAQEFGYAMNDLNLGIKGFWNQIGQDALPVVKQLVETINRDVLPAILGWEKGLDDAFKKGGLEGGIKYVTDSLGKLVDSAAKYLEGQWPTIDKALRQWGRDYWNWLTGPNGVYSQIADKMGEFAKGLDQWAKDPATSSQMQAIGMSMGEGILNGLGSMLDDKHAQDTLTKFGESLLKARLSIDQVLATVGAGIAGGILESLVSKIVGADAAKSISDSFTTMMRRAIAAVIGPNGPILGIMGLLWETMVTNLEEITGAYSMEELGNKIIDALARALYVAQTSLVTLGAIASMVGELMGRIAGKIGENIKAVQDALGKVISGAINAILDLLKLPHSLNPLNGLYAGLFASYQQGLGGMALPALQLPAAPSYSLPNGGASSYYYNHVDTHQDRRVYGPTYVMSGGTNSNVTSLLRSLQGA